MLNNISNSILRASKKATLARLSSINYKQCASFGTVEKSGSVMDAWKKSCYYEMDFTISEEEKVFDAVKKFSAFDVGALVTTNEAGELTGLISERDYIKKIALLGQSCKDLQIKEIYTHGANIISASVDESIDDCMEKMMTKSIRHLPIMDGKKLVGLVSIKDLIKETVSDKEATIKQLSEMALGKS